LPSITSSQENPASIRKEGNTSEFGEMERAITQLEKGGWRDGFDGLMGGASMLNAKKVNPRYILVTEVKSTKLDEDG